MTARRPFSGGLTATLGDRAYLGDTLTAGESKMVRRAVTGIKRLETGKPKQKTMTKVSRPREAAVQTEETAEDDGTGAGGWTRKVAAAVVAERGVEKEMNKTIRRQIPTLHNANADQNFNELYASLGRMKTRIPVLPEEFQKEIKARTITDYDKEKIMNEPYFTSFETNALIKPQGSIPGIMTMTDGTNLRLESAIKIQSAYRGHLVRKSRHEKVFGRKAPVPAAYSKSNTPFVFDLLSTRATSKGLDESKLPSTHRRLIDKLRNMEISDSELRWAEQAKSDTSYDRAGETQPYREEVFNFDELAKNLAEIDRLNKDTQKLLYDDNPSLDRKGLIDLLRKGVEEEENRSSVKKSRNLRWKDQAAREKIKTEGSVPENLDEIEMEIATARSSRREGIEISQSIMIGRKLSPRQMKRE